MSTELYSKKQTAVVPFDGLQIGEACFAVGKVLEDKWYKARLLGLRSRSPPLKVEYISTLDGDTNTLLLPVPRRDYVHVEHVRRNRQDCVPPPLQKMQNIVPREPKAQWDEVATVAGEANKGLTPTGEAAFDAGEPLDDVVVDEDLMCTVCERPDDEANMLVCDCKAGYHTYCLSPPLANVPEGVWCCTKCTTNTSTHC